jgi:hypothetical protein
MGGRVEARGVEVQSDERSLNLDAIRASLEEAAAVLAEMTDLDASRDRARVGDTGRFLVR